MYCLEKPRGQGPPPLGLEDLRVVEVRDLRQYGDDVAPVAGGTLDRVAVERQGPEVRQIAELDDAAHVGYVVAVQVEDSQFLELHELVVDLVDPVVGQIEPAEVRGILEEVVGELVELGQGDEGVVAEPHGTGEVVVVGGSLGQTADTVGLGGALEQVSCGNRRIPLDAIFFFFFS